jgi:hypothetical protein
MNNCTTGTYAVRDGDYGNDPLKPSSDHKDASTSRKDETATFLKQLVCQSQGPVALRGSTRPKLSLNSSGRPFEEFSEIVHNPKGNCNRKKPIRRFFFKIIPGTVRIGLLCMHLSCTRLPTNKAFWLLKIRIRISKSETNSKSEIPERPAHRRTPANVLSLVLWNLFRISIFGFRVFSTGTIRS